MRKQVFRIGDSVRIKAGPFSAFTGKIDGINQSKALLKVMVRIFGRRTPIPIRFVDAEKLEFDSPSPPQQTRD
jgi:transcriptional antiterminator NusG